MTVYLSSARAATAEHVGVVPSVAESFPALSREFGGAMDETEPFVENRQFGRYLRRVREDRKLSLDAVEEMTSEFPDRVTKSHLSRIENGSAVPSFGKMFALSQIYGIPIASMAERFEIDLLRESRAVDVSNLTAAAALDDLERMELTGAYQEEVALASAMLDAIETGRLSAKLEEAVALRIFLIDALAHLERYESAKVQCEQLLSAKLPTRRQRLQVLLCFVICSYRLKRYTIAEMALVQAAAELGHSEIPREMHATVRAVRAVVETALGQLEAAIESYKEAISLYLQIPVPFEVCRAQLNLGQTLIFAGDAEKALPYIRTALKTAEQSGYDRLRALALSHLAVVHYQRDETDAAEAYAVRSNTIARSREFLTLIFRNCFYLRKIALRRGDAAAAGVNDRTLRAYLNKIDTELPELNEYRAELEGGSR
jgi:transcriptional regulator with XRE-family HTH domain